MNVLTMKLFRTSLICFSSLFVSMAVCQANSESETGTEQDSTYLSTNYKNSWEIDASEKSEKQNQHEVGENRNSLGLVAFGGLSASNVSASNDDVLDRLWGGGVAIEYRYTVYDGRCVECGLGNRINFFARLGGSSYEGDEEFGYYDYGYNYYWDESSYYRITETAETTSFFGSVGINWEHQLSSGVSTVFGIFAGVEYVKLDLDIDADLVWKGSSSTASSFSANYSDSNYGVFGSATLGLNFALSEHHTIEFGADVSYSTTKIEDLDIDYRLYVNGRIGYSYHF